jgi:hypothetical protein
MVHVGTPGSTCRRTVYRQSAIRPYRMVAHAGLRDFEHGQGGQQFRRVPNQCRQNDKIRRVSRGQEPDGVRARRCKQLLPGITVEREDRFFRIHDRVLAARHLDRYQQQGYRTDGHYLFQDIAHRDDHHQGIHQYQII